MNSFEIQALSGQSTTSILLSPAVLFFASLAIVDTTDDVVEGEFEGGNGFPISEESDLSFSIDETNEFTAITGSIEHFRVIASNFVS